MRTDIEWVISALEDEFDTDENMYVLYTRTSDSAEKLELVFYFDEGTVKMLLWNSVTDRVDYEHKNLFEVIKDRFKTVIRRFNIINNHIK
jgi:hypothetical protein